ncbi:YqhR family membrane protein [Paenibacillus sp. CN-4]|uniref:YqhR family membrane protein n=1 Tax=Paenibacillus nanchangensis TaxID=3348343 RepID=UPI00397B1B88
MSNKYQPKRNTNVVLFALELGFFAGLIWGGVRWILYSLKFTKVVPGFLAEPFFKHDFLVKAEGHLTGYLFFIVFSILSALLYALLFRRLKGPLPGLVYGVLWWSVLYLACSRLFLLLPPFKLDWDSAVTDFCVFLLWGMFIGYTTAFEYTDERKRDRQMKMA